ncbi:MAG TPA: hypothetical protein VLC09_04530 [Polyangiaceae bacterium]|nr:hypothetical protein [Polyangiaceae bacterium]
MTWRISRLALASSLSLAALACGDPGAISGGNCPITEDQLNGNVIIESDYDCAFQTVDFAGGVDVKPGATVRLKDGTVAGDFQAADAGALQLEHVTVHGNLQASSGADVSLVSLDVSGNIQLENNEGSMTIRGNEVSGNIELKGQKGTSVVERNVAGGNLTCEGNDPAPSGGENAAAGTKQGQCSGL